MAELTSRMKELVQPYLAGIEPYNPNFTPTRINLSANENTYPVPAGVREAVDAALAATPLNRYPDPMSNDLRDELATTAAALAVAEAQLPCPEVAPQQPATAAAPLLATVRFKINSAVIQPYEEVNVYNVARWMKSNPDQNVTISGYADKDTGTSEYNMDLSKRRAEAVRDQLVNKYGICPDRLSIQAEGSNVQPYDVNNWNRIVIFTD